jgi:coproporphyrinogen III oxidase-like Fe-S oxidoreductase
VPVRSGDGAIRGVRWKNVPRLSDWMQGVEQSGGYSPVVDYEGPDARRALAERIMTGLRLNEGLPLEAVLQDAHQVGARAVLEKGLAHAQRSGHLALRRHDDVERVVLTREGLLLADGIAADLMACVDDPSARGSVA